MKPLLEISELEQFLLDAKATGSLVSEGAFTLNREHALKKLAKFQLPFEGAWAVKIIQSIVAGGAGKAIAVKLSKNQIKFSFENTDFSLEEVEKYFLDPGASPKRALLHLINGLWATGIKNRWPFQLCLAGESYALVWDGQNFQHSKLDKSTPTSLLTILAKPAFQHELEAADAAEEASLRASDRNANILRALVSKCYVCPLPLTVDNLRLDSFLYSPQHGATNANYPLELGFIDPPLKSVAIPPYTFESTSKSALPDKAGLGWRGVGNARLIKLKRQTQAGAAYIFCLHMLGKGKGDLGNESQFQGPSIAYWVYDGALIAEDRLTEGMLYCSMGVFINADGLDTDLTSLSLRKSKERQQRIALLYSDLVKVLEQVARDRFKELGKQQNPTENNVGKAMIGLGILALPFHPIAWPLLIGGVFSSIIMSKSNYKDALKKEVRDSASRLKNKMLAAKDKSGTTI